MTDLVMIVSDHDIIIVHSLEISHDYSAPV
jgi:hypothetical protein